MPKKAPTGKSKAICKTCKYFSQKEDDRTVGECHYDPPVFAPPQNLNAFPSVDNNNFCGKYRPKETNNAASVHILAHELSATRVHILAREVNVKSTAIVKKCRGHNFDIKNHMSKVSPGLAGLIREWFSEPK